MTGEITLRGQVLPVGGIKEKALAAQRAGVTTFIIPRRNEVDLDDLPENLIQELNIVLVDTIDEALQVALPEEFTLRRETPRDGLKASGATESRDKVAAKSAD